jgi:hypothetical protein
MDWLPLLASGTTPATTTAPATTTTSSDDNPFQPVLDFFDSATFQAIVKLFGLMLVALWLASAFFVFKDVPPVQGAARAALEGLPVLRDRGALRRAGRGRRLHERAAARRPALAPAGLAVAVATAAVAPHG